MQIVWNENGSLVVRTNERERSIGPFQFRVQPACLGLRLERQVAAVRQSHLRLRSGLCTQMSVGEHHHASVSEWSRDGDLEILHMKIPGRRAALLQRDHLLSNAAHYAP